MENILNPERDFFFNPDVVEVARQLIGKVLVTNIDGVETAGLIVETEAYCGLTDRACHAFPMKRTRRTEPMFLPGGHVYVYLCYGLHYLFNLVTGPEDEPDAVLIRALEPLRGIPFMMQRRNMQALSPRLVSGPACLAQAMGISMVQNGLQLSRQNGIWLEDPEPALKENLTLDIGATTRVGVAYAGPDAARPWRFFLRKNKWVSALPKHLLSAG